jgi:hypothetical protein
LNVEELMKDIDKVDHKLVLDYQTIIEFKEDVLVYTVLNVFVLELFQ